MAQETDLTGTIRADRSGRLLPFPSLSCLLVAARGKQGPKTHQAPDQDTHKHSTLGSRPAPKRLSRSSCSLHNSVAFSPPPAGQSIITKLFPETSSVRSISADRLQLPPELLSQFLSSSGFSHKDIKRLYSILFCGWLYGGDILIMFLHFLLFFRFDFLDNTLIPLVCDTLYRQFQYSYPIPGFEFMYLSINWKRHKKIWIRTGWDGQTCKHCLSMGPSWYITRRRRLRIWSRKRSWGTLVNNNIGEDVQETWSDLECNQNRSQIWNVWKNATKFFFIVNQHPSEICMDKFT